MSGGESDSGEKPFEATQKRLDDARRKGDIPLSAELTQTAALCGLALVALGFGSTLIEAAARTLRGFLQAPAGFVTAAPDGGWRQVIGPALGDLVGALSPWLMVPAVLATVSLAAQRAPVFAPSKLAVKASRMSPLSNFKQKLGKQGLVAFAKSLGKFILLSLVVLQFLWREHERIMTLMLLPGAQGFAQMTGMATQVILRVALVSLGFAMFDLVWQNHSHRQKMRMSHKDLRDEMKESEGDPALKQQRRARAVEIATKPLHKAVAEADVVIVNPTHYAVALAWDRKGNRPPHCVAKGTDAMAARIRALAAEHGVPLHSDPPTARLLHATLAVGQEIDRAHFPAVAAAIRFSDLMRKKAKR